MWAEEQLEESGGLKWEQLEDGRERFMTSPGLFLCSPSFFQSGWWAERQTHTHSSSAPSQHLSVGKEQDSFQTAVHQVSKFRWRGGSVWYFFSRGPVRPLNSLNDSDLDRKSCWETAGSLTGFDANWSFYPAAFLFADHFPSSWWIEQSVAFKHAGTFSFDWRWDPASCRSSL